MKTNRFVHLYLKRGKIICQAQRDRGDTMSPEEWEQEKMKRRLEKEAFERKLPAKNVAVQKYATCLKV